MENGKIVKKMGKELLFIKAEINMMVIGKKEKRVVKEFIILKMEIFLKENGKMEKNGKGVFYYKDKNLEEEGFWEDDILKKEDIK